MAVGRKPGTKKTGGRTKGTVNKTTASVKAAMLHAFKGVGGNAGFTRWAKENPTEFYKLWAKMLPQEINAEVNQTGNAGQVVIFLPHNGRDPKQ